MRAILVLVFCSLLVLGGFAPLLAQEYPSNPITLIIPMAPGDGLDVAGRWMAEEMSNLLKVSVVVQNKPGATGTVGTEFVTKSKKDGYTLLFTNSASVIYAKILNPENVPYDSFKDLTPLGLTTISPALLTVQSEAPYKDLKSFVEYSRQNKGKVRCGIPGVGSVSDFDVEIIKRAAGADITTVPFKGAMPAVTALLGGHVEAVTAALGPLSGQIKTGKVKGLVISDRFPEFPEIPTLQSLGYKEDLLGVWFAFFGPSDLPPPVTRALVTVIKKVAEDPALSAKLAKMGNVQVFEPPEKALARMQREYKMAEEIVSKAGMRK